MNSYQRLKNRIKELENEVRILALNEDSIEAFNIRLKYKLQNSIETIVMQGEATKTKLTGIL